MNNRVLVTGSSRGIGKAIALKLAVAGFDIALHYHSNQTAADATAAEVRALGVNASLLKFDVADRATSEPPLKPTSRPMVPIMA